MMAETDACTILIRTTDVSERGEREGASCVASPSPRSEAQTCAVVFLFSILICDTSVLAGFCLLLSTHADRDQDHSGFPPDRIFCLSCLLQAADPFSCHVRTRLARDTYAGKMMRLRLFPSASIRFFRISDTSPRLCRPPA